MTTHHPDPISRAEALVAARALLPELCDAEDIRRALHLASTADAIALRLDGLPFARIGSRYFVLRADFARWLRDRAEREEVGRAH